MTPAPANLAYLPYQQIGIDFAKAHDRTLIADEMGVGKTIQAIGLANAVGAIRILVVCPATLKINWSRELEKWLVAPLSISFAEKYLGADVVIVNYDRLEKFIGELRAICWDLVIVDEAHYVKNPTAKRTKALLGNGGLRTKRLLFLTGTPVENRPIELWPMLQAIDKSFGSYHEFGRRYCGGQEMVVIQHMPAADRAKLYAMAGRTPVVPVGLWSAFVARHKPNLAKVKLRRTWDYKGASNIPELRERLRAVMIRRTKAEVLPDLPEKRRQVIELTNGKALVHEAAAMKDVASKLQAQEFAVAFDKLAEARHQTARDKLPQCVEFIKDVLENTEKVVVFAHHHDILDGLQAGLAEFNPSWVRGGMPDWEKQLYVDRFQNADSRVFVGQIQAAGVGLTLTAAHTVVFVEQDWAPAKIAQAEDRCHRIGQKTCVTVYFLVAEKSLDARVMRAIASKQHLIDQMLEQPAVPVWAEAIAAE